MAEENGQTGTTEAVTTPVPIIGEDGKFTENWRETLPEDIREEKCLQTFGDIQGMSKSLVHALRTVGKDKITVPSETATDEEWGEYYKAGGRPDTAADYNFAKPDDFPEELYSQDYANEVQDIFFKFGGSKKLATALFAHNLGYVLKQAKAKNDADDFDLKEVEDGLYRDWGNAYEQKKHLGNVAIERGVAGDEEFKARLVEKFGKNPDFVRFASNIGSKFAEHGDIAVTGIPTPQEMDAKIKEEMAKDSYTNPKHPNHKNQVLLVARLFREKNKSTKTG